MNKTIAVVGAGITGIMTAYYLAKAGHNVFVYEQEPHVAMRTSYANGGQVSVSNSEVWTTWSNVQKGAKWIFTKDAPLLIRPKLDVKQWSWISKFLYNTMIGVYKENTEKTIKMGLESRELYSNLIESEQIEFDQTASGILHFYKNRKYFDAAIKVKQLYNDNGVDWEIISGEEIPNIDPAIKHLNYMEGGAWTASDWTGDIHKFCYQLAKILNKKYGVQFFMNCTPNIKSLSKVYDAVIVCAGVGSVKLAKQVGDSLPIYPVKGYSITINNVHPELLPKVSLLDDQAKIVTSSLGNRFRIAGTAELAGENYDIRRDRIQPLLDWVHINFPNIDTHDYSSWACLRPMTPDMLPIVKQSTKNKKVFYNTGHGHLGWTLAPCTAKLVSEMV